MAAVCFYFQVHQPLRLKRFRIFDVGLDGNYFNDGSDGNLNNEKILWKVARKSYLPTNAVLLQLLQQHPEFKISFSFSGVLLEQLQKHAPEVVESFQKIVDTGRAEVLSETYHHSLASVYSATEFACQVRLHDELVKQVFKVTPRVFRNTELIYSDDIARQVEEMGFGGILAEGADHVLEWRSPNFLYKAPTDKGLPMLLKNYRLSDDIAFRFSNRDWVEYPLTSEKFARWVHDVNGNGEVVNLFMDYETFGEHQWEETGILEFLRHLPAKILEHPDNTFVTPSEAMSRFSSVGELSIPHYVSWADVERDLSAWMENSMQREALKKVYALEAEVIASGDPLLIEDWRRMQTSDHFYYMCTKWFADGDVHKYFNPYDSPYEAFISYMNVLQDLKLRLKKLNKQTALPKTSEDMHQMEALLRKLQTVGTPPSGPLEYSSKVN